MRRQDVGAREAVMEGDGWIGTNGFWVRMGKALVGCVDGGVGDDLYDVHLPKTE